MKLQRYALLLVLLLALTAPALGQGCSMCSSAAGATGEKGRKTFTRAVAVLLFPTLGIGALIVGAAFRYRNRDAQDSLPTVTDLNRSCPPSDGERAL